MDLLGRRTVAAIGVRAEFTDADGTVVEPTAVSLPAGIPRKVPHVITFDEAGDGRTRVTVTEHGYATEDDASVSKAGLEQCLDKMTSAFDHATPRPAESLR